MLEPLLHKALIRQEVRGRPLELPLREVVDAIRYDFFTLIVSK